MKKLKLWPIFLTLVVSAAFYQNCSKVDFMANSQPRLSGIKSQNGTPYDGMTSFYQTKPQFTCQGQPNFEAEITENLNSYVLTANSTDQCQSIYRQALDPSKISHSNYDPDFIGYNAGIFTRSENPPDPTSTSYSEAWCQPEVADPLNGMDIAISYDLSTNEATAQIYYAETANQMTFIKTISPFAVNRNISMTTSLYTSDSVSLTIDRTTPGVNGWDYGGLLSTTIDGVSSTRNLVCRIAGPNTWTSRIPSSPLTPRDSFTSVWTGTKMLVWGGSDQNGHLLGDGGQLDPINNTWSKLANSPLSARDFHSAVWTGNEMIIWGGLDLNYPQMVTADGARYDLNSDSWTPMATSPLANRQNHVSFWTGTKMIIWGGTGWPNGTYNDGALYDPVADHWSLMASCPLSIRSGFASAFAGSKMIIWGGLDSGTGLTRADGAIYDSETNSWSLMSTSPLLPAAFSTAVSNGSEIIIQGGSSSPSPTSLNFINQGATFNPLTNSWKSISPNPFGGYLGTSAVWAGKKVVYWSGSQSHFPTATQGASTNAGYIYDPSTDKWIVMSPAFLQGRTGSASLWAGSFVIFWGGGQLVTTNTGGSSVSIPNTGLTSYSLYYSDGGTFAP